MPLVRRLGPRRMAGAWPGRGRRKAEGGWDDVLREKIAEEPAEVDEEAWTRGRRCLFVVDRAGGGRGARED